MRIRLRSADSASGRTRARKSGRGIEFWNRARKRTGEHGSLADAERSDAERAGAECANAGCAGEERGGDAGFREGNPRQWEAADLRSQRGLSRRQAPRPMAGGLQCNACGLQGQREPYWNFTCRYRGRDEERVDRGQCERELRSEGIVHSGVLEIRRRYSAVCDEGCKLAARLARRRCGAIEGYTFRRTGAAARGKS